MNAHVVPLLVCGAMACSVAAPAPVEPSRPAPAIPALAGARSPPGAWRMTASLDAVDDAARVGEWDVARSRLDEAAQAWAQVAGTVGGDGSDRTRRVGDQDIARLRTYLEVRDAEHARKMSTALIGLLADILDRYLSKVPPDVLRLDAALRRVRLDADVLDWPMAAEDAQRAAAAWSRLSPLIVAVGQIGLEPAGMAHIQGDMVEALDRLTAAVRARNASVVVTRSEEADQEVGALYPLWRTDGDTSP